jgi:hypothetical protein
MKYGGPVALGVFGFVLLLFIGLSLGVGVLGVLMIIGAVAWTFRMAPKCPSCHRPWTLQQVSTEIVGQQRGFGLVTRIETHTGQVGNQATSNVVRRQERAPIITSTIRINYVCRRCKKPTFKQYVQSKEDFTPQPSPRSAPVIVNVQAAQAPKPQTFLHCRYCGALNPSEAVGAGMHCTSCGATL